MLFKISNVGMQDKLSEYIDSIRTNANLDVITMTEKNEWASSVIGSEITSDNTYAALFGEVDIMIIQDLLSTQ